jgi:hypothetical protein
LKLTHQLLFVFTLLPFISNAQNKEQSGIDSLSSDFVKYVRSFNKEKILLQTDKSIYANGEIIYFKAFPVDSISNRLINSLKNYMLIL